MMATLRYPTLSALRDEQVFEAHPEQVLTDALDLLGIPHDHV